MLLDDLTGVRFGNLVVISKSRKHQFPSGQIEILWLCKCDCGNEVEVFGRNLKTGNTKSCGCLRENLKTKHGLWGSKVYKCWDNMRSRCYNKNMTEYDCYGGRGIRVCDEWKNNFQTFYDYVSKLPHFGEKGYSIDRINNDGNYEPSNVRWATAKEQANNQQRTRKRLKDYGLY